MKWSYAGLVRVENILRFLRDRKEAGMFMGEISVCQSRGCPLKTKPKPFGTVQLELPFHFVIKTKHFHSISMTGELIEHLLSARHCPWNVMCTVPFNSHNDL